MLSAASPPSFVPGVQAKSPAANNLRALAKICGNGGTQYATGLLSSGIVQPAGSATALKGTAAGSCALLSSEIGMFVVDTIILLTGVLLLLGIVSSKFSARFGVPVLVLFLAVGMLAGSEGIGGIDFEDFGLAHGIGTIALAIILFDGGLSTPVGSLKLSWRPAIVLATVGVLITAVITGLAVAWILELSVLEGMLLGSIVGSTDAAAVFAVLRYGGVRLPDRLASVLEVESGSNDPMAIFLTVGCIEVIMGRIELGPELLGLFVRQMAVGAGAGLLIAYATVWIVNRINLDAAGLYPVLVSACGLLAYGFAAALGGSGFLAIYLAGIVIGNSRIVFQRGVFLFHNAGAWLSQIVMFTVLGLLSFPSRLMNVSGYGLLIAAVLTFVARPVAVVISLLPFRFNRRELVFLSWVGLKGAVPITLATFPLMFGVPHAAMIFDIVFFVVLVSAAIQGWSLPLFARLLRLDMPHVAEPPLTLEISSLRHVEGDIVDYTVSDDSQVAGRLVKDIAMPEGVVIAIVARGQQIIPPQGNTRILPGDHAILVLRPGTKPLVDRVFGRATEERLQLPASLEFPLRASTTVSELEEFYGIQMDAAPQQTLDEFLKSRLGPERVKIGAVVHLEQIALVVRDITDGGSIESVGMIVLEQPALESLDELGSDTANEEPSIDDTASTNEARNG
jgi:cell volume regulation protein A